MSRPTLPPRREGDHQDTVSMRCLDEDAAAAFERATERFYAINRWHELNDSIHTAFQLCDPRGEPVDRHPRPADRIRIDVAGPGSPSAGGYDWVEITAVETGTDPTPFHALTVTPCAPPDAPAGGGVAHFYAAGATNTFVLRRIDDCLLAEVHGRNERPNTGEVPALDRIRNEALALAGMVGLGKIQWQDWTDGLVSVV